MLGAELADCTPPTCPQCKLPMAGGPSVITVPIRGGMMRAAVQLNLPYRCLTPGCVRR